MRKIITSIALAVAAITAIPAQAAVLVGSINTQVTSLLMESDSIYGFVGVATPFFGCTRVYVNLNTTVGQQYMALAKVAWVTGDNVTIRAYNDVLYKGACSAFDILVQH